MNNHPSPLVGWTFLALAGTACSGTEPAGAARVQPLSVVISDNAYAPSSVVAEVGSQVTWQWQGTLQHSVIFDNNDPGSPLQAAGTFSRTFTTVGSFTYHCEIHGASGMTGVVTVRSGGTGPAPPPPGPYPARN
jgi:plastocyanin